MLANVKSREYCSENDFLSNMDNFIIFLAAFVRLICGITKVAGLVVTLMTVSGCLILLQVQETNFMMSNTMVRVRDW